MLLTREKSGIIKRESASVRADFGEPEEIDRNNLEGNAA